MKKYIKDRSVLTSILGIILIVLGAWAFHVHWISNQTVYFNLVYGELSAIAVIAAGVGLIHGHKK